MKDIYGNTLPVGHYIVLEKAPSDQDSDFIDMETESGMGSLNGGKANWYHRSDEKWAFGPLAFHHDLIVAEEKSIQRRRALAAEKSRIECNEPMTHAMGLFIESALERDRNGN